MNFYFKKFTSLKKILTDNVDSKFSSYCIGNLVCLNQSGRHFDLIDLMQLDVTFIKDESQHDVEANMQECNILVKEFEL